MSYCHMWTVKPRVDTESYKKQKAIDCLHFTTTTLFKQIYVKILIKSDIVYRQ